MASFGPSKSAATLTSENPIVPFGEIWVEHDTGLAKRGDGGTAWTSLPYWDPSATFRQVGMAAAMYGASGEYWSHPVAHGTAALTAGQVYLTPVWVPYDVVLDRIGAEVTTGAASSTLTLGVYNDNGAGRPSTLVFDAGTIDGNSVAAQEITISKKLRGGKLYHLAALCAGGTPTVRVLSTAGGGWQGRQGSLANATGTGAIRHAVIQGSVVGTALPNPTTATTPSGTVPLVAVRFA